MAPFVLSAVASLSYGTYSKVAAHTICISQEHDAELACNSLADIDNNEDSGEEEGIKKHATAQATQQSEVQGVSFPDRIVNLVDTFARLVMVI